MAAWPRRQSQRQSSGEHLHGADAYRTRMEGTGRSGVLGRRWSYGGGAGVARRELRAVMATAELRELGGCCCEEERPRRSENGARLGAGGRWREEGAPRRVVAYADRPAATRGRFTHHAAAMLCAGRPPKRRFSLSDKQSLMPDSTVC